MTGPTLTAPFKNESHDPRGFTYIPVEDVIERLNVVLGVGQWSYEVEVVHVGDTGVAVKGRLSACGGVYEQFGGQNYNRFSDKHKTSPGEIMDIGNDFKGAASDALKKCAQQIGVGLYIPLGHSPQFSSAADPQAGAEDSGSRDPHPPAPAPSAGGEELEPAPPPRQSASSGNTTPKGRRSVPKGETSQPVGENPDDQAAGAGDPQGKEAPAADLSRADLQARIDSLSEAQRLKLRTKWVESRMLPLKDAVLEPPYVAKVVALIESVVAA